jgi:hypothetical protein
MKKLIIGIIALFLGLAISPSISGYTTQVISIKEKKITEVITTSSDEINHGGSLSGYVTDLLMRPIEGAKIQVYFHGICEEDYSDSTGYYHITNISICKCLKETTASKVGYKTKNILLAIHENSIHTFILRPRLINILREVFVENNIPSQILDYLIVKIH